MCTANPFAHFSNSDLSFHHQDLLNKYAESSGRAREDAPILRDLELVESLMLARNLFAESCYFD